MKRKVVSLGMTALLVFAGTAGAACDKEDKKDVKEIGNKIDNKVDQLDTDGKDD